MAEENAGPDAARPFVEAAGATFPVLVDDDARLANALGYKVIPNGILVDEEGVIRWAKFGGFSVDEPDHRDAVARFASGGEPGTTRLPEQPYRLSAVETDLVQTKLRLGRLLEQGGKHNEAIAEWQDALRIDPENLVVRKQIWALRFPERFHPVIDWDWQKEQFAKERAEEIEQGICGPDGCPIR